APSFTRVGAAAAAPVGRDNRRGRPGPHAEGHVYAAFYRRKGSIAGGYNADVVVVRDDNWGKTMPPFLNLVDTVTMVAGQNVVAMTPVSDSPGGNDPHLRLEWWGGDPFLAGGPHTSSPAAIS